MGEGKREEMTREEAAAILKRSVEELNDTLAGVTLTEGPEAAIRRNIDAYSMAVDALLEKVEAKDAEEAEEIVEALYRKGEIVLDAGDFIGEPTITCK